MAFSKICQRNVFQKCTNSNLLLYKRLKLIDCCKMSYLCDCAILTDTTAVLKRKIFPRSKNSTAITSITPNNRRSISTTDFITATIAHSTKNTTKVIATASTTSTSTVNCALEIMSQKRFFHDGNIVSTYTYLLLQVALAEWEEAQKRRSRRRRTMLIINANSNVNAI